jgi:hypothetical protein
MADFAREPSDSQIDGGMRIGSKRQAAGARRAVGGGGGGGGVRGMSTTRRKRERSPPGQRACHIKAHFQSGIVLHHWLGNLGSARPVSLAFGYLDVSSCPTCAMFLSQIPLRHPRIESTVIHFLVHLASTVAHHCATPVSDQKHGGPRAFACFVEDARQLERLGQHRIVHICLLSSAGD